MDDMMDMDELWGGTNAADDKGFEPLPTGKYKAICNSARLDQNDNGKHLIKYEFTVLSGDHEGRKVWNNSYLTPKALPYAKRDLQSLGVNTDVPFSRLPFELEAVIDKTVELSLGLDTYGDKPRNKVKSMRLLSAFDEQASKTLNEDVPF